MVFTIPSSQTFAVLAYMSVHLWFVAIQVAGLATQDPLYAI